MEVRSGRARLKLTPGQRGTKKLARQYGDRLVCVRYRYDAHRKRRYKTVELIVESVAWEPARSKKDGRTVRVRIGPKEYGLQHQVRQSGGRWNPQQRLWVMSYGQVKTLGLIDRVVEKSI